MKQHVRRFDIHPEQARLDALAAWYEPLPCADKPKLGFDCPTFEPLDYSQWCENCRTNNPVNYPKG